MNYTTCLNGIEFYAFHGLYPAEQKIGGIFKVDVSITTETTGTFQDISDVINYENVYGIIKHEMSIPTPLIETLAYRILKQLQSHYAQAISIKVTVHKPNPAGLFKSGSSSVTLEA